MAHTHTHITQDYLRSSFPPGKSLAALGHDPSTWHGSSPLLEQHWGLVQSGAPGTLRFALVCLGFILLCSSLLYIYLISLDFAWRILNNSIPNQFACRFAFGSSTVAGGLLRLVLFLSFSIDLWVQSGTAVQYCQCFVFSGVLTTIGRSLGLATRSVTNFQSAHDVNSDRGVSKFLIWRKDKAFPLRDGSGTHRISHCISFVLLLILRIAFLIPHWPAQVFLFHAAGHLGSCGFSRWTMPRLVWEIQEMRRLWDSVSILSFSRFFWSSQYSSWFLAFHNLNRWTWAHVRQHTRTHKMDGL